MLSLVCLYLSTQRSLCVDCFDIVTISDVTPIFPPPSLNSVITENNKNDNKIKIGTESLSQIIGMKKWPPWSGIVGTLPVTPPSPPLLLISLRSDNGDKYFLVPPPHHQSWHWPICTVNQGWTSDVVTVAMLPAIHPQLRLPQL